MDDSCLKNEEKEYLIDKITSEDDVILLQDKYSGEIIEPPNIDRYPGNERLKLSLKIPHNNLCGKIYTIFFELTDIQSSDHILTALKAVRT